MPCIFCTNPHAAGEPIFDDGRVLVLLHPDWAVCGHAMVVWRGHVENASDLTPDEHAHFGNVHLRAERALLDATGTDRAILLKLGILTPHLHLHIYPVSSALNRDQVMEIIDGKTAHPISDDDRRTLIEELQRRLVDVTVA